MRALVAFPCPPPVLRLDLRVTIFRHSCRKESLPRALTRATAAATRDKGKEAQHRPERCLRAAAAALGRLLAAGRLALCFLSRIGRCRFVCGARLEVVAVTAAR